VSTLREELMAAMVDLVDAHGYEAVSVEQVAARAGVGEAEFGALFASKDECALAILEEIGTTTLRNTQAAYDRGGSWPDSLRAAAYEQAAWISENPKRTRFSILEMLWVNDLTRATREHFFKRFIAMIDGGREVAPDPEAIPTHAAEAVIGSITQMLTKQLQKGDETDPFAFIPELMYMAVLPYLGEEIAEKELTMPPPAGMPQR
jgi:AcrR family transcriptional regulator